MRAVLALAPRLRRAGEDRSVTPTALAVAAFAVTTALTLSVVGGLRGFVAREADPPSWLDASMAPTYVILAWVAVVLLVVPLLALAGAAARLGVARRDARLATLRLLGVTPREVVVLTAVETAAQGLVGAVLGVVGHALLLPVWAQVPFQGRPFTAGELWVGWAGAVLALLVVPLLAALSGAASLRRVVVSPLGVARRTTPPGMRAVRVLGVVGALVAFVVGARVMNRLGEAVAIALMLGLLALVLGTLNLVGPWTVGVVGRLMARRGGPARLLAARRLLDDPRAAWRVVGGLGLASFVAAVLSVMPGFTVLSGESDPQTELLVADLVTGGVLTLAIAYVVAAVAAGIAQAAGVLDRRREHALQLLAGVPVELFDAVRRREVLVPLLAVSLTSAGVGLVVLLPLFGASLVVRPDGLLLLLGCLVVGTLAVLAATEASRPLLRATAATTVVRAD
ncbi:FtsX-like permease family protein [Cellulomonas endophytica]|uniref:FtsX-like permease family protein n=1 Tax=Cellulomonas endophytica TaxID=2494735 RepID=UPI001013AD75|nr:FtsX-like permease family protein [Cellulomonas endophytica]